MWRSEDRFLESFLSFHHVGLLIWTQVMKLRGRCPLPAEPPCQPLVSVLDTSLWLARRSLEKVDAFSVWPAWDCVWVQSMSDKEGCWIHKVSLNSCESAGASSVAYFVSWAWATNFPQRQKQASLKPTIWPHPGILAFFVFYGQARLNKPKVFHIRSLERPESGCRR